MREKNGKALCALIGATVTGRNYSAPKDFDLDAALIVAYSHNLLPIAYHALKKAVLSKRLGTGKESMKKRYPVLKKAPFLFPFCYGFKAVKCAVVHPKEALSIVGYLRGMSDKNIKRREKLLSDVGLYEKLKK